MSSSWDTTTPREQLDKAEACLKEVYETFLDVDHGAPRHWKAAWFRLADLARLGAMVSGLYIDEDYCDYASEIGRYIEEYRENHEP